MRLIFVFLFRENYFKWWIKVEGLNHTEIRHLAEKIGEQPEHQVDSEKLAEFSVPSWLVRLRVLRAFFCLFWGVVSLGLFQH